MTFKLKTKREYDAYITGMKDLKKSIIADIDNTIDLWEGRKMFFDEVKEAKER